VTHVMPIHLYWTILLNTYSPGLLTILLYVVLFYTLIRYGVGDGPITERDFAIGTIVGVATIEAFLTVGPTVLFPRLTHNNRE
jgi:hypothetical protein